MYWRFDWFKKCSNNLFANFQIFAEARCFEIFWLRPCSIRTGQFPCSIHCSGPENVVKLLQNIPIPYSLISLWKYFKDQLSLCTWILHKSHHQLPWSFACYWTPLCRRNPKITSTCPFFSWNVILMQFSGFRFIYILENP